MMEQAKALAQEGKAVVLVLHDLAMALERADYLAVLQNGRCLVQGDPESVFCSGCLETVFGVQVGRVQTADGWKYYFSDKNLIKTE
jgi:iron complex transport system ATP-binding protein